MKKTRESPWLLVYVNGVIAVGIAVALVALADLPQDRFGLMLFSGLAAIAQLADVELFSNSRSRVSVSSIVAIAGIILFGPLAGVLIHMISGVATVITTTLRSREPERERATWLQRASFNTAMFGIAAAIAGQTYVFLNAITSNLGWLANTLPLIAAAAADTLANVILLIGVLVLQTGRKPVEFWKQDFQWAVPIAILGGALGGGALALAYEMFHFLGLAVFFLPVLATSYSFRLYVTKTKGYIDRLEVVNQSLEKANLKLETANLGLLEVVGSVIDAYDLYTYGHSNQVAMYAAAIAEQMGLPEAEQAEIVKAALVHDVGKIGVPDNIIGKQGPLTDDEYMVLKRHPLIGAEILGRMEGLRNLTTLVRHHHERWDGKGYPDGLEAREIPIGARILAVADSMDAMLSDRPYRPTRSLKEVIEEIKVCSGKQFDPAVVEAFMAVVNVKDRSFFNNSAATVDNKVGMIGIATGSKTLRYLKKSMLPEA